MSYIPVALHEHEIFPYWPHIENKPLDREFNAEAKVTWVKPNGQKSQGQISTFTASGRVYVRLAYVSRPVEIDTRDLRWGWV